MLTIYYDENKKTNGLPKEITLEIIGVEGIREELEMLIFVRGATLDIALDKLIKRYEHETGNVFPKEYNLTPLI